jgi:tetratricopeptide (TPR) repeat protein
MSGFMHEVEQALEPGDVYEKNHDETLLEVEIAAWQHILLQPIFKQTPQDFQALTYGRAGQSFFNRYHSKRQLEDLEMTRKLFNEGLQHVIDAPLHAVLLHSLGDVLTNLHRRRGKLGDLEESIAYYRDAIAHIGPNDTNWPAYMDDLGTALHDYYTYTGDLLHLDESIKTHRQMLNVATVSSSSLSAYFNHLGNALLDRYQHLEQLNDLQEAIESFEQAVQGAPPNGRPGYLSNLGNALSSRSKHLQEIADLERAIQLQKEAVHLAPQEAYFQTNLGSVLGYYYDRTGQLEVLNESIAAFKRAIEVDISPTSSDLVDYHVNLSTSLEKRYDLLRQPEDLQQANSHCKMAFELTRISRAQ